MAYAKKGSAKANLSARMDAMMGKGAWVGKPAMVSAKRMISGKGKKK